MQLQGLFGDKMRVICECYNVFILYNCLSQIRPFPPYKHVPTSHLSSTGYNWVLIQALVFCYTICTFAAAADSKSAPYGFLTIWSMMITLALSAGGTMVLRRVDYRTCVFIAVSRRPAFHQTPETQSAAPSPPFPTLSPLQPTGTSRWAS